MIVGTWWSTHVIFNLVKIPLVLVKNNTQRFFFNVSNEEEKLIHDWLQTSQRYFFSSFQIWFNFILLVFFGRFPWPKKCICWPKKWIFGMFLRWIFFKHSILIICHGGHFSFSLFSLTTWPSIKSVLRVHNLSLFLIELKKRQPNWANVFDHWS